MTAGPAGAGGAVRLLLVRHASTAQTRRALFPSTTGAAHVDGCAGLDAGGAAEAGRLRGLLPVPDRTWASHAARAVETAARAGLDVDECLGDLAEADFGRWAGRSMIDVATEDMDALAAWHADPSTTPHGGEPLADVRRRAARVLARAADAGGTTVAITSGGLVKAALLEALGLPDRLLWRFDVAPASVTELSLGPGADPPSGWRVVGVSWTPALRGAPPRASGAKTRAGAGAGAAP